MSISPTTLTRRTGIMFCLAGHPRANKDPELAELICTRIDQHLTHCCDEVARKAWNARGKPTGCVKAHDHSAEKGLA